MKLAADEVDIIRSLFAHGPVLMYADRSALPDAPARFLVAHNLQELVGGLPTDIGDLYRRLGALVVSDHRDRLRRACDLSLARRPVRVEVEMRDREGQMRWWRISSTPLDDSLMFGFLWDITESIDAASEAQAARAEAEESRDRALAANRAKTEFLSRMSHELRTPLNSIVGFGQLLERQQLASPEQEWVDSLVVAGRHLLTLIDEVLDVVGIESGRLSVSVEPVDVVDVVDEAIGMLRALADEWNVSLHRRAPAEHAWATGDHRRLLQILLHLIDNAIRYNRDGGSVSITAETFGGRTIVVVDDTGRGMGADEVAKAFQPFDRLGVERTGIEGTGMGLTLSRSLAELMNGTLTMTSTIGSGSSLRLELPNAEPAEVASVAPATNETAVSAAGEQLTILYIEDNVANLRLMESVMELRPTVTLLTAMRGKLGFEIARDQHPGLVLVDLHLPDIDGRQVLRMLRDEPSTVDLPVAVVSADATPGRIDELRALGADHYLTKPIDIRELIAIVDQHLGGTGGPRAGAS